MKVSEIPVDLVPERFLRNQSPTSSLCRLRYGPPALQASQSNVPALTGALLHVRGQIGLALVIGVAAARGRASLALVLRTQLR